MLFNLHDSECFDFFPWGCFLISVPCGQRKCLIWFQLSWICWGLFCVLSCGLSLKIFHVHLKKMCILLLLEESVYIYQLSPFDSRTLFNAAISLLIFCLEDLPIFDRGVLKTPTIIVLLSISFLKSSKISFMSLGAPMLGEYMFIMFISPWWILLLSIMKCPSGSLFMAFVLKSVLSDMIIAIRIFFPVHLLEIFISSPSLSVCVGLLFSGGCLVDWIYMGHILSIQVSYVVVLELFTHLVLRLLLIGT